MKKGSCYRGKQNENLFLLKNEKLIHFAEHFNGGLYPFGNVENSIAVCISCVQILDYQFAMCICIFIDTLLETDGRAGKM